MPVARKVASPIEQRRNQRQYDRDRASPLRSAFPLVARLQIELNFPNARESAPGASPQTYVLYPPARAFFRYPCPCQDCDGEFDMTDNVRGLASFTNAAARSRTVQLRCQGMRSRDRISGSVCPIELSCRIVVTRAA